MTQLLVGIDVGSMTVKVVAVHPDSLEILWARHERHETRQGENLLAMMEDLATAFPDTGTWRLFATGTGAEPLAEPLGAACVPEVNAILRAVERWHPDAGSFLELGGQDAKVVIFRDVEGGERRVFASMNDKCASGTGATIDKCLVKVGMPYADLVRLHFDDTRLHHVAAKCGVFAETDIVSLVKSGIPSGEIMNSLGNAIVHQNLSVLTRGHTLRHKVLLLGGPNAYLPFLVECWRRRIPETWAERGYAYPADRPVEDLVCLPDHAAYFPAYGAVLHGLDEAAETVFRGLEGLRRFLSTGREGRVAKLAGPALVADESELRGFLAAYGKPPFQPRPLHCGEVLRVVVGMDGGSTSSKAVLLDEEGEVVHCTYRISKGNPIQDARELLSEFRDWAVGQGASLDILGFGATGYAADVLEETLKADVNVVETIAHKIGAVRYYPTVDVICDVGGQDIKILFLRHGEVLSFRLNNQCSAGNGMLLQMMAEQFGVAMDRYAEVAFSARVAPVFSYGCGVFLDTDRVNFQKEGFSAAEMLSGLAQVLPKNIWQYIVQVPRLAQFGTRFLLQGGTQRNLAAVKAQVDYIVRRVPGADVRVHPYCGEAGAIGVAIETLRCVQRKGESSFVGLEEAIGLRYSSRNDESTLCGFCANRCSRTFIDARTPDGRTSRYISGFACENGLVEDRSALRDLARDRAERRRRYPNLIHEEASLAFRSSGEPTPMPEEGTPWPDVVVRRRWFYGVRRTEVLRGFRRSSEAARAARRQTKIGMPRVLNMYSTAPFWRGYFETLGVPAENLVWSGVTSEEQWRAGCKYGSVDPCFPSKVVQAHIHELLFRRHTDPATGPLTYLYFPGLACVSSWVKNAVDSSCCSIVAGSPNVIRAAFTKEVDFFARAGAEYVNGVVRLSEPNLMRRILFETWKDRLGVTQDESDFAVGEGYRALEAFHAHMQGRGREILEEVEARNGLAVLLLGRPYHNDPGLNHGIPGELQALGYPVLSIRGIPKDPVWLQRFFGREDPLDINDVWRENFSANSAQRVWAAKFAARHPHVAVLDISSFKCGHDAPTFGIIDPIVAAGRKPYLAIHDIDANKPTGSIKLRVRTFAQSLRRYEMELARSRQPRGIAAGSRVEVREPEEVAVG